MRCRPMTDINLPPQFDGDDSCFQKLKIQNIAYVIITFVGLRSKVQVDMKAFPTGTPFEKLRALSPWSFERAALGVEGDVTFSASPVNIKHLFDQAQKKALLDVAMTKEPKFTGLLSGAAVEDDAEEPQSETESAAAEPQGKTAKTKATPRAMPRMGSRSRRRLPMPRAKSAGEPSNAAAPEEQAEERQQPDKEIAETPRRKMARKTPQPQSDVKGKLAITMDENNVRPPPAPKKVK